MNVEVVEKISRIAERDWNRLVGGRYPFLRHEFLRAAEESGCVSPDTGWTPRHLLLNDDRGRVVAAMPLYEKSHSWGEFVFDWAWARAYERAGLEYYPKLVSATPFTPAPSRRILLADDADRDSTRVLLQAALQLAEESGCSSLHVQFPHADELAALEEAGLKLRKDCQFHWHNRGYESFDQFLQQFSSSKRKKVRRDRRHVAEQQIRFRWYGGRDMDMTLWRDVYRLISMTFMRRGSMPYFSLEFFVEISRRLPDNIAVVIAERHGRPVAAAVFYVGPDTLYGRYWGADDQYNSLHFETCYYQGIEYCISRGIRVFEPGTQGEHKISRGFVPETTWSAHWLARPEFLDAVARYLDDEQAHVEGYIEAVQRHSPYRDRADGGDSGSGDRS